MTNEARHAPSDDVERLRITAHRIIDILGPDNLANAVLLLGITLTHEAADRGAEVPPLFE